MSKAQKKDVGHTPRVFLIPDLAYDRYRVWCSWNFGDQFDLVPKEQVEAAMPLLQMMTNVVTICNDGEFPEDYGY